MAEIRPRKIRLETSTFCQLRCPSCPTATKAIYPALGAGFLKLKDFQDLIDRNPRLKRIELSNYGEILLNPDLLGMLRYAHERGVVLTAANGVNLNHVRDEVLEGLVKYGMRSLTCSVDGASQETYGVYRVRGDFDRVMEHIRRINFYKEQYGSPYPELQWQFVVFGHNEHEIPLARQMARELNMKIRFKLTWDPAFSPIRDEEAVRREVGAVSRDEFKQKRGRDYSRKICDQLWDDPQINWDGRVLGCCRNFWGDFGGNAFSEGLQESVNNEKMTYAREMLQGRRAPREDIPCTTCSLYQDMQAEGRWLERKQVSLPRRALRFLYRSLGWRASRRVPEAGRALS